MTVDLATVPVVGDPGDTAFLFAFGAYGDTHLAVFADHLEDALEEAFEWLDENAPGLLCWTHENAEECARELGIPWPLPEGFDHCGDDGATLNDACSVDLTVCGHTTLKNGDAIPSWEWTADELSREDTGKLCARFFADAVGRELEGCEAFSVGACPGCDVCGLGEEPTEEERCAAEEAHFSRSRCESCGTSMAGDRHPAHWLHEGQIQHCDVCTDCLFYHANGDTPERWTP